MSHAAHLSTAIDERTAQIGVIGLGYVGLPLALEFAKAGFQVTGFDLDGDKIRVLEQGGSYIEDVPADEVKAAIEAGKLRATADFAALRETDIINVCVPTPLTRSKDPDLSHMQSAVREIQGRLRPGQLVVLGSTTYPGTTHELYLPLLEETRMKCGEDFFLAFAPERIDPGNTKFGVHDVPKVVGGETPEATELACKIFGTVFDKTVPVTSTQSAEMVKLLENTFRAINIGLANEVALMCDRLGLDVWEVIDAAATKPYGFMKFTPGPGLGGHCIPVDPTYLSWKMKSLGFNARFIELATDINSGMPEHVVDKVTELLNQERLAVNGARVLLLGVAYKPDVADLRESPALDIMQLLLDKGADLRFHDPHVPEVGLDGRSLKGVELTDEELAAADLVVIVTDHSAVDFDRVVDRAQRIFDTRNATRGVRDGREKIHKL